MQRVEYAKMSLVFILKAGKIFRSIDRYLLDRDITHNCRLRGRRSNEYLEPEQSDCQHDRGSKECELCLSHGHLVV